MSSIIITLLSVVIMIRSTGIENLGKLKWNIIINNLFLASLSSQIMLISAFFHSLEYFSISYRSSKLGMIWTQ